MTVQPTTKDMIEATVKHTMRRIYTGIEWVINENLPTSDVDDALGTITAFGEVMIKDLKECMQRLAMIKLIPTITN